MKSTKTEQEQEFREEAERLATIPFEDQKAVLAIYRECAENKQHTREEKAWNKARVEALERHLKRLNRKKKPG